MHLSMHSELIKSVFSNARFYLELNCLIFEKVFFSYFVIWEFEETRVLFRCELSTKTPIHMNFSHLLPPWLWLCCGTLDMVESPLLYSAGLRISSILEIYCAWENLFRRIPVHFNSNILVLFLISIVKFPDLLMVTLLLKLPSGYQTMPSSGFCRKKTRRYYRYNCRYCKYLPGRGGALQSRISRPTWAAPSCRRWSCRSSPAASPPGSPWPQQIQCSEEIYI